MNAAATRAVGLTVCLSSIVALCGCPTAGTDGGGGLLPGGLFPGGDPLNKAPLAIVTVLPGGSAPPGSRVTLDASASTDPDGDPLTFLWTQTGGPAVALSDTAAPAPTFDAPSVSSSTQMVFSVAVRDSRGAESTASAALTVEVGGEFSGNPQSVAAYRDNLSSDEAYHLYRRAAFGAKPDQVAQAVQRGLGATVDDLMTVKNEPDWVNILAEEYEESVQYRWMLYMIEGNNPLRERLALFWHDRFATSRRVTDFRDRNLGVLHWHLLRGYALGNYRTFLEQLTLDPLMLIWLDGANSPKDDPNENYAREFWELFTLGRDVLYTEDDIREGARAFTGITLLRQNNLDARPIFDILNHDETNKMVFPGRTNGAAANYNYDTLIELTLAQPEAGQYVARNLFACFVHDHPSDEVVNELAALLRASNWELAPVIRKILTSQAFFSAEARGNQVTSPVEHVVGVARTLDMHIYSEDSQGYVFDQLISDLSQSGQDLLNPPGVEGWKEDDGWLKDQWIINRVRALGRTMEYGPAFTADLPYHLLPSPDTWNQREVREQIVNAIAAVFHVALTEEERAVYVEVLDQNGWKAFHLEDPRYQPQHVFEMIRLMAMDERVIGR